VYEEEEKEGGMLRTTQWIFSRESRACAGIVRMQNPVQ
jgi:hypothetical protein